MRRGEIYWCTESITADGVIWSANRPCVIVSDDHLACSSPVVDVVFLTTRKKRNLPTHAPVTSSGQPSTALCEQIVAAPVSALGTRIAVCTREEQAGIDRALAASIGLSARLDFAEPVEPDPLEIVGASIRETKERCDQELLLVTRAERDTYKRMYETLLAHLTGARP